MFKTIIIVALFCLMAYGCGKDKAPEGRLIAKINNYKMTVEDFGDEARLTVGARYPYEDPAKAKEAVLDEIILKKILLQEAQKQNFDKEKTFMKEIERYWEQALLKLLYKKKSEELSAMITVRDSEVKNEYKRLVDSGDINAAVEPFEKAAMRLQADIRTTKMQQLFEKWLTDLRKRSNVRIYKENLQDVEIE